MIEAVVPGKIRQPAYSVIEAGDIIWGYIGPSEVKPPLPRYWWMDVPNENRAIQRFELDCNYLQPLDAALDISHVSALHRDVLDGVEPPAGETPETKTSRAAILFDAAPSVEIQETDFGYYAASFHQVEGAPDIDPAAGSGPLVRITPFLMPTGWMHAQALTGYVTPQDDTHTSSFAVVASRDRQVTLEGVHAIGGASVPGQFVGPNGKLAATRSNRYLQDRQAMREGRAWAGLHGGFVQDGSVCISMGPIVDRTLEHLVPSDQSVVRARSMLLEAAKRVERGEAPQAVRKSDLTAVRADTAVLAAGGNWLELLPSQNG